MQQEPVPPDPGRDEDPRRVPPWPDWMDDPAYLAARAGDEDPGDVDLDEDSDNVPPSDVDYDELVAEAERIAAEQAREAAVLAGLGLTAAMAADAAAAAGRRGPGMPGSAQSVPGVYASRASGFASGKPLDTAPGCVTLASFAEEAAGEDDRYPGASDDELAGVIAAWAARRHHAGRHGRRPGQSAQTPRARGQEDPGGAVGRGLRQRGPGRAGTATRAGTGRRPAGDGVGQAAAQGRGAGRDGCVAGPGLPGHIARHGLPAPRRQVRRQPAADLGSGSEWAAGRDDPARVRRPGHPDHP